jgi:hypothetical protein
MQAPVTIFVHNTKTGGATLRRILLRQYEPDEVLTITGEHYRCSGLERWLAGADRAKLKMVQGHVPFGIHELVPSAPMYVTLVRDPIDRILSWYHYKLERKEIEGSRDGRPIGLEEYILKVRSKEVDNVQTRRLSGLDPEFGECPDEMLERAKLNLRQHFAVVGVTEKFDHTLILLKRLLGWRHILYFKINVTRERPAAAALSTGALDLLRRHNALDLELHKYARDLFDETVRRQGPDLEAEVETFKRVNEEYARFEVYAADKERRAVGAVGRRGGPTSWEGELRAAVFEEHPRLLARQFELTHQLKRMRKREATLGGEIVARLREEVDRGHEREATLRQELKRRRREETRLRKRAESLEKKLAAARQRPRPAEASPLSHLGTRLRELRGWVRARFPA